MIWIEEYVTSGFSGQGSIISISLFRILFGFSCLIKFSVETSRGYYSYFGKRSYLYFLYRISRPTVRFGERTYKFLYVVKCISACTVLVGVLTIPSLLVLIVAFLVEIRVYFKFHTCLFLLVSCLLCFSPCAEALSVLTLIELRNVSLWIRSDIEKSGDILSQVLLVATLSILYVSTAIRKLNRAFLSGLVVFRTLQFVHGEKSRRLSLDGYYPKWFVSKFVKQCDTQLQKLWSPLMVATVGVELFLPAMLLSENFIFLGISIGILMHTGFTLMFPLTLGHFSLLTVSLYLLFLDPDQVAATLLSLISRC